MDGRNGYFSCEASEGSFDRICLSAMWSEELKQHLKYRVREPYTMSLVGEDKDSVIAAVNQGIDAYLEACFVPSRGDSYSAGERKFTATSDSEHWKIGDEVVHTRTLECVVSPESLIVLIRRLLEGADEGCLASAICGQFDIELV